jgi:hypothetical protein
MSSLEGQLIGEAKNVSHCRLGSKVANLALQGLSRRHAVAPAKPESHDLYESDSDSLLTAIDSGMNRRVSRN